MWVRFFKSKDDTYYMVETILPPEVETILLEIRRLHARHHFESGAFVPVLRLDSDYLF
jgi:hypothetical protein